MTILSNRSPQFNIYAWNKQFKDNFKNKNSLPSKILDYIFRILLATFMVKDKT